MNSGKVCLLSIPSEQTSPASAEIQIRSKRRVARIAHTLDRHHRRLGRGRGRSRASRETTIGVPSAKSAASRPARRPPAIAPGAVAARRQQRQEDEVVRPSSTDGALSPPISVPIAPTMCPSGG